MRRLAVLPQLLIGPLLAMSTGHWWLAGLSLLGLASLASRSFPVATSEMQISERDGRVWAQNRRLGIFPWLWPQHVRQILLQQLVTRSEGQLRESFEGFLRSSRTSLLVGISPENGAVYLPETNSHFHLLILGVTGSGKTELLRNLLSQWPGRTWCADYKGGLGLAGRSHFESFTSNVDPEREKFWKNLLSLLEATELSLAQGSKPKPVLLLIDELALAISEPAASQAIEIVARKGRSLGFSIIAATQTLGQIPRSVWANLQCRIILAPVEQMDALQLGIKSTHLQTLRVHDGVLKTPEAVKQFSFPLGLEKSARLSESSSHNPLLDFARQAPEDFGN